MPPRRRVGRTVFIAVVALTLVCTGIELGNWQLRRAAQKEALQAELDAKSKLPVLEQDAFLALDNAAQVMHQPVRLRGLWLTPQTVYLDNRQMHGIPGFYVLTPFALLDTNQTIMVQRGWVQRNFESREALQPVETPAGLVDIAGVIAPPPAQLLELGKADGKTGAADAARPANGAGGSGSVGDKPAPPEAAAAASQPAAAPDTQPAGAGAPSQTPSTPAPPESAAAPGTAPAPGSAVGSSAIRQNLDLEAYRTETGLPLRTDVTLQQTGAASQGLQRDWPAPAFGIERHYGYAFQWFGLSALVAILYVWFQFIVPLRRRRRARHG